MFLYEFFSIYLRAYSSSSGLALICSFSGNYRDAAWADVYVILIFVRLRSNLCMAQIKFTYGSKQIWTGSKTSQKVASKV